MSGRGTAEVGRSATGVGSRMPRLGKEPPWWGRRTLRLGKEMSMSEKEPSWWGRSHCGGVGH